MRSSGSQAVSDDDGDQAQPGSGRALFLDAQEDIDEAISSVCGRNGLYGADRDDFASTVRLRLLEDDSAVLRKFQGRCRRRTFLVAVVSNCLSDYRNSRWGKWRPSAAAKSLGRLALLIEELTVRDGHTGAEALELIRTQHGLAVSDDEFDSIRAQLGRRPKRRFVELDEVFNFPSSEPSPEDLALKSAEDWVQKEKMRAIRTALQDLGHDDKLLLVMRFRDERTMGEIGDALGVEPKPLYRRLNRVLREVKGLFENRTRKPRPPMPATRVEPLAAQEPGNL